MTPMFLPAPPDGLQSFSLGPVTIHSYALCILAGIFVALWLTTRRWVERGGDGELVGEIALWAIPFGIVGGRIYHVISTPGPYFGEGGDPWAALEIWNGGLGIWGAVALGALGAFIGARRQGVSFTAWADAAAPAVLIAQAIGRLGNYLNQELFGSPSTLPWALEVDAAFRPDGFAQFATFHPTFLYEMVWNLAGAALIVALDRRYDLRGGRVFWLYVMVYVSGRLWIEMVRIDTAVTVGGLRINVWVSIAALTLAVVLFALLGRRTPPEGERVPRNLLAAPTDRAATASADSTAIDEAAAADADSGSTVSVPPDSGTLISDDLDTSPHPADDGRSDDPATSQGKS